MAFLQTEQMKDQSVTTGEVISVIKEVIVEQEPLDPRQWNVRVTVYSKSFTETKLVSISLK